jgi:hypothetical protein
MSTLEYPDINTAIAHLREVLGDGTYESLAHKGENGGDKGGAALFKATV